MSRIDVSQYVISWKNGVIQVLLVPSSVWCSSLTGPVCGGIRKTRTLRVSRDLKPRGYPQTSGLDLGVLRIQPVLLHHIAPVSLPCGV